MDDKNLEMLEFPKIREILAEYTSFSTSRQLALSIYPSSSRDGITLLLKQSAEARHLLSLDPDFAIGTAVDVREAAEMAARAKILEPHVLVNVQLTLAAARYARTRLHKLSDQLPALWDIADRFIELRYLEDEIGKCLTDRGEILDTASEKLYDVRHRLKDTRHHLLDRLNAIIRSDEGHRFVQDDFIDERDGRYVIPVKVEFRGEVKGIVHDVSNTGATVFMEPMATVELGNEYRELVIEERHEIERILRSLSADVGVNRIEITQNVELLAELDLILAKAKYAKAVNAVEPQIAGADDLDGKELRIVDARHPLLRGKIVPLSIEIGSDFSILVVTGPNTGGKTVALKTVGLLSLMTQAGIPIPASEQSCIPIFDGIFVDIGDEQSIEQTLSTFSWHMGNIVRIIRDSTKRSLVLLDELGTGTDPNEGAVLARAILLHFLSSGALVVATSHFSELKVFAHSTDGLQNASFDFDPVTLAPTYRMTVGIPGGSNALAIAEQLGLSSEIINSAQGMLSKSSQDIEALLSDIMSEKQRMEATRLELEKEKTEAQRLREHLDKEFRELKEREKSIIREAKDRVIRESEELQKWIREAATELKKEKSEERIEEARKKLDAVREQLKGEIWQPRADDDDSKIAVTVSVGDEVWLEDIDLWGTVLSLSSEEGQLEVQVGHTRLRLSLDDVGKVRPPDGKQMPDYHAVRKISSGKPVSLELDLRGKRAEEIEPLLDTYINDTSMAHFNRVRIIHGYGTGTVRQIVRDMLASHPLVKSFWPGQQGEGGDGVTMVEL